MEIDSSRTNDAIALSTAIWRYMDLSRFVAMLATRTLRFTKAAKFLDDPYEGFCKAVHRPISSPHQHDGRGPFKIEGAEQMLAHVSRWTAQRCENARDHLYVNSWFLGRESMAMWEIYGSRGCGMAVTSTTARYQSAVRLDVPTDQYSFGHVKYHDNIESSPDVRRDFSKGAIPASGKLWKEEILPLGFHKRSCYEYEAEWRAVVYQDLRPESGIDVDVDLERLITDVYVGPRAESFVFDVVRAIMDKFQLLKPLRRSVLLGEPERLPEKLSTTQTCRTAPLH